MKKTPSLSLEEKISRLEIHLHKARAQLELKKSSKRSSRNNQSEVQELKQLCQNLEKQIKNWKAYQKLEVTAEVTDGERFGTIAEKRITLEDAPEILVTWADCEQPVSAEPTKLEIVKWSDWFWDGNRITRKNENNPAQIQECSDRLYLSNRINSIEEKRGKLIPSANCLTGESQQQSNQIEKIDLELEYIRKRLAPLEPAAGSEPSPDPDGTSSNEPKLIEPAREPAKSVEIVETEELTYQEYGDRHRLEQKIERIFYEAGCALRELRDRRLYRNTHKTFEKYCRSRFGFGRHAANYLIAGAGVFENLVTIGHQNQPDEMVTIGHQNQPDEMVTNGYQNQSSEMVTNGSQNQPDEMVTIGHQNQSGEMLTNGSQILPTNERQVRPLINLNPDQQRQVWFQAVEEAGGKVPSSRIVKRIADRLKQTNSVEPDTGEPNPEQATEVEIIGTGDRETTSDPNSSTPERRKKSKKVWQEGPNRIPGKGNIWLIESNESTWKKLDSYHQKVGTPTREAAIDRLLDTAERAELPYPTDDLLVALSSNIGNFDNQRIELLLEIIASSHPDTIRKIAEKHHQQK